MAQVPNQACRSVGLLGIVVSAPGFAIFIPVLGPNLLFIATVGGVLWNLLIARIFFRTGWSGLDA
jgi:hypothetical protein